MLKKWHALALAVTLAPTTAFAGFELGVKGKNIPPVPGPAGIQVVTVDPTGPAAAIGIAPGDTIFGIDPETGAGAQKVTTLEQLNGFMQQSQGTVRLWWTHGFGETNVEVHLRVTDPGVVNLHRKK